VTGARRLVVLRHGETTHNAAGIWQGHLDSPLSARGLAQAEAAGRALKALAPTEVVGSDLVRAARTADAVAAACGTPVSYDARFREIHAGEWQGMSGAEVREQYPQDMDRLLRGEDFRRGGTGESVAEVAARCREAADELLGRLPVGGCVVVATHGVSGRALVASLVDLDQQLAWVALSGLGNACWAELEEGRLGWRIRTWNACAPDAGGVSTSLA
jgi:broad specificity phosphatase PhoE